MRKSIPGKHGGTLRPFAPGQSGNPAGRPPDVMRLMARLLDRHDGVLNDAADQLASVLKDRDHKHWLGAFREVLARVDGPAAGAGDTITRAQAQELVRTVIEVIREELDEKAAEHLVCAIQDRLNNERTVSAHVRSPDGDDEGG